MNIQNKKKLKIWQCTGIAESELAHITDVYFETIPSILKTGFRWHKPNIEVKVWYTDHPELKSHFDKYEI